jgi:hypothetical protein
VGVVESGFAGSVGARQGDHNGPMVEWGRHC